MKYGIKVTFGDDEWTWMTVMSEYTTTGNLKPAEYNSLVEAKDAAENMRLKGYRVEPITPE